MATNPKVAEAVRAMEEALKSQNRTSVQSNPNAKSQRLDDDDTGSRFSKVNRKIETKRRAKKL